MIRQPLIIAMSALPIELPALRIHSFKRFVDTILFRFRCNDNLYFPIYGRKIEIYIFFRKEFCEVVRIVDMNGHYKC